MIPNGDRKTALENSPNSQASPSLQALELQNATEAAPIQALFDRIAPAYDQLNDWLSLGQHRIWKQMAVKWSQPHLDRKSTRLNSSHANISYAVFCLKKKKQTYSNKLYKALDNTPLTSYI